MIPGILTSLSIQLLKKWVSSFLDSTLFNYWVTLGPLLKDRILKKKTLQKTLTPKKNTEKQSLVALAISIA